MVAAVAEDDVEGVCEGICYRRMRHSGFEGSLEREGKGIKSW